MSIVPPPASRHAPLNESGFRESRKPFRWRFHQQDFRAETSLLATETCGMPHLLSLSHGTDLREGLRLGRTRLSGWERLNGCGKADNAFTQHLAAETSGLK